jgi:hypothetical protein
MTAPPRTWRKQVGRAWVTIDFEAEAIDIRFSDDLTARTVEAEPGVVNLDYDVDGHLTMVEVLT